jgi:hypothetical protein
MWSAGAPLIRVGRRQFGGNLVDADGYSSARIAILTSTLTQNHLLKTF